MTNFQRSSQLRSIILSVQAVGYRHAKMYTPAQKLDNALDEAISFDY